MNWSEFLIEICFQAEEAFIAAASMKVLDLKVLNMAIKSKKKCYCKQIQHFYAMISIVPLSYIHLHLQIFKHMLDAASIRGQEIWYAHIMKSMVNCVESCLEIVLILGRNKYDLV